MLSRQDCEELAKVLTERYEGRPLPGRGKAKVVVTATRKRVLVQLMPDDDTLLSPDTGRVGELPKDPLKS